MCGKVNKEFNLVQTIIFSSCCNPTIVDGTILRCTIVETLTERFANFKATSNLMKVKIQIIFLQRNALIKRKVNTFRGVGGFGEVMVSVEEGNIKSALY